MSCCGGKRAALASGWREPRSIVETEPVVEPPAPPERRPRMFEYVGGSPLTVRGAVSGAVYRFAHRGDRLEIAANDVFAMMAERDVRPAAQRG